MARRQAEGEKGFVITLELVLIFTVLGIGLMVGIVAIRNALFVYWQNKKAQTVWVYDSSVDGSGAPAPNLLLPVRDFDEHEAPRVFFVDRNVEWCVPFGAVDCTDLERNYRAFVGVRDDRFTTRPRVFYSELGCTGKPCLPSVSNETADNLAIGYLNSAIDTNNDGTADAFDTAQLQFAGGVGYLYALQHGPNYGVGADIDQTYNGLRLPGTLYRQTADACLEGGESILSVWTSQEVTSAEPCLNLPATLEIESAKCPSGQEGDAAGEPCNVSPNVDPRCVTGGTCAGGVNVGLSCYENSHCPGSTCTLTPSLICACPVGWAKDVGANCCPPGSTHTPAGQCVIGTDGVFFLATPVQHADGSGNAFANLTPPFLVNLPPDPLRFEMLAPSGTEGVAGTPTGVPYSPERDFDFGVAPASEGGSPP